MGINDERKSNYFPTGAIEAHAAPPNTKPKDAVRRAMALWTEAEGEIAEHENRMEYLRCLFGTQDGNADT